MSSPARASAAAAESAATTEPAKASEPATSPTPASASHGDEDRHAPGTATPAAPTPSSTPAERPHDEHHHEEEEEDRTGRESDAAPRRDVLRQRKLAQVRRQGCIDVEPELRREALCDALGDERQPGAVVAPRKQRCRLTAERRRHPVGNEALRPLRHLDAALASSTRVGFLGNEQHHGASVAGAITGIAATPHAPFAPDRQT